MKAKQIKVNDRYDNGARPEEGIVSNVRLNLNDLLKRRKEEMKDNKKTNLLIFSGAAAVAVVIVAILSL